ncbi:MAG: pyridoxamine 5'-phosphate oxidase family protein [Acidimicrobiales bacterium]
MTIEIPDHVDTFLRGTRFGVLVDAGEPWPHAAPVWFDWTGEVIEFFTQPTRPKVTRLQAQPMASMLVSSELGEPIFWAAIDGRAELSDDAADLVEMLAARYCDLTKPEFVALHDDIVAVRNDFLRVTIAPERCRYFKG